MQPDIIEAARGLIAAKRYRAARRLLASRPDLPPGGLALLGTACLGLKDFQPALLHLRRAADLDPDDIGIRVQLARACTAAGLPHVSIALMEPLAMAPPVRADAWEALAAAYRLDARYADAVRLSARAASAGGQTGQLLYEEAMCRHALGDAAAALAAWDRLLDRQPGLAAGWFQSHAAALQVRSLEDAIDRLDRATACHGANGKYWAFLAAYALLDGRDGDAAAILDGPLRDRPHHHAPVDGVRALLPRRAADFRLFGCGADLLRHGVGLAARQGLVLEFGVRRGTSIGHIAEVAGQEVHGFDSFEGLPEDWGTQRRGSFTTGLELPAVGSNVTLHAGWFDDTLPPFLAGHSAPVRFANIDCDIYSSTRTVLTALAGRLAPGAILVFDEFIGNRTWREHEYRAFMECAAETDMGYEYASACPFTGQVAVRIL
ncbi:class I SAM-dependent methyltransferase [Skermanella sp. TT6]|uniref:Class I SAM-dependent methyltransferase n=1 Tax=Skermanella cutis TaxID=2775420 RepID=A0ABX7B2H0_9PROT|nr:class I SAM-dependent methyltransferase [Skermanella sp. TT6]QQP88520.1 class I SAM-dependent methyltransferase [Skermanella sp. TT6]